MVAVPAGFLKLHEHSVKNFRGMGPELYFLPHPRCSHRVFLAPSGRAPVTAFHHSSGGQPCDPAKRCLSRSGLRWMNSNKFLRNR